MGIDFIALDGDEPAAFIRCAQRNLDLLARRIILLVELDFEFGIAVERTGEIGLTRDGPLDPVHARIAGADEQRVVAGLVGGQAIVDTACGNHQRRRADRHFLEPRFVFVELQNPAWSAPRRSAARSIVPAGL